MDIELKKRVLSSRQIGEGGGEGKFWGKKEEKQQYLRMKLVLPGLSVKFVDEKTVCVDSSGRSTQTSSENFQNYEVCYCGGVRSATQLNNIQRIQMAMITTLLKHQKYVIHGAYIKYSIQRWIIYQYTVNPVWQMRLVSQWLFTWFGILTCCAWKLIFSSATRVFPGYSGSLLLPYQKLKVVFHFNLIVPKRISLFPEY